MIRWTGRTTRLAIHTEIAGAAAAFSPLQNALSDHVESNCADRYLVLFRGYLKCHAACHHVRSLLEFFFRTPLSSLITLNDTVIFSLYEHTSGIGKVRQIRLTFNRWEWAARIAIITGYHTNGIRFDILLLCKLLIRLHFYHTRGFGKSRFASAKGFL